MAKELVESAVVPDHSIDDRHALFITHLRRQARPRVFFAKASKLHEPLERGGRFYEDRPRFVELKEGSVLSTKEGNRREDHWAAGVVKLARNLLADVAVRDVIQPTQCTFVVKNDVGEKATIDLAAVVKYGSAERVKQSVPCWLTLFHDSSRDDVRVNHWKPEVRESFGNGRFPGTDPARDNDSFHRSTVLTATYMPDRSGFALPKRSGTLTNVHTGPKGELWLDI